MSWRESVTEEERKAVEEFRRQNAAECSTKMLEDDTLFYRFMKARDFNMKNAEDMLKKHIAWRKEYQIDSLLTDYKPPETVVKYTPITFIGFDKEGDIVKHIDVGRGDSKGMLNAVKRMDIFRYNIQIYEQDLVKLQEHSKKLGRTVNKIVYIYNFEKMTFAKATNKKVLEFMMIASKMYQDNYPEHIKCMFIVNATIYFKMLFSMLKTCLAAPVIEKIRIFGSDGYQDPLLEMIDGEVLPAFLGGNRTDPDGNPNCNSFMIWGKEIPEELYLNQSDRTLCSVPGTKQLNVPRFSKVDVRLIVEEPDSIIEWEFEMRNRDIGFGIWYETGKKSIESIIPVQRADTFFEPETGMYKCEKPGTYVIVFDNSYSWFHSKDVFYRVRIIHPNDKLWK